MFAHVPDYVTKGNWLGKETGVDFLILVRFVGCAGSGDSSRHVGRLATWPSKERWWWWCWKRATNNNIIMMMLVLVMLMMMVTGADRWQPDQCQGIADKRARSPPLSRSLLQSATSRGRGGRCRQGALHFFLPTYFGLFGVDDIKLKECRWNFFLSKHKS